MAISLGITTAHPWGESATRPCTLFRNTLAVLLLLGMKHQAYRVVAPCQHAAEQHPWACPIAVSRLNSPALRGFFRRAD
jgi:hypothetical protein